MWHGTLLGRKDMKKLCDIQPLFFHPLKYTYGREIDCAQFFHPEDIILLQVLSDEGAPEGKLYSVSEGTESALVFSSYELGESGDTLYYTTLSGLDEGIYYVEVIGEDSEPFAIRTDKRGSVLIKASHKDNNSIYNNVFWLDNIQQFVSIRVPGGFKPEDIAYQLESESFRNQFQEISYQYAVPYEVMRLTVGTNAGVPEWFGGWLNRVFCLSHTSVEGVLYRRSEDSVPEKTVTIEGSERYVFKMSLEKAENDISGAGGVREPGVPGAGGGSAFFDIKDAKDGEMLIFNETKNAFVNEGVIQ